MTLQNQQHHEWRLWNYWSDSITALIDSVISTDHKPSRSQPGHCKKGNSTGGYTKRSIVWQAKKAILLLGVGLVNLQLEYCVLLCLDNLRFYEELEWFVLEKGKSW